MKIETKYDIGDKVWVYKPISECNAIPFQPDDKVAPVRITIEAIGIRRNEILYCTSDYGWSAFRESEIRKTKIGLFDGRSE